MTSDHYLVEEGYLSKTEFHDLDYEGSGAIADEDFFVSEGREVPQDILDAIASDGMCNAMIMEKVAELVSRARKVLSATMSSMLTRFPVS